MCVILSFLYQSDDAYEMKTENQGVYIKSYVYGVAGVQIVKVGISVDATSHFYPLN